MSTAKAGIVSSGKSEGKDAETLLTQNDTYDSYADTRGTDSTATLGALEELSGEDDTDEFAQPGSHLQEGGVLRAESKLYDDRGSEGAHT